MFYVNDLKNFKEVAFMLESRLSKPTISYLSLKTKIR